MDRDLFVPLKGEHFWNFWSGEKDIELRHTSSQFTRENVRVGYVTELRRGYSTDDSLWGAVSDVWPLHTIEQLRTVHDLDHERIVPGKSWSAFVDSAYDLLGDREGYIAFRVDVPAKADGDWLCPRCGSTDDVVPAWDDDRGEKMRALDPSKPDYLGCDCEDGLISVTDREVPARGQA